jgi:hypothetical protein
MSWLLWYIPLVPLALLASVLFRTRAYSVCPWFSAYVTFAVGAGVVRVVLRYHRSAYFMAYWVTEAGYAVLGILVMYEVYRTMLGNLIRARWAHLIFPSIVLVSICLGIARNQASAAQLGGRLMLYIVTSEMAVRFVQVLIFAGLVTLVPILGLRWRQYSFGVATGFGLYSTVMLLTTTRFSDFGTKFKFLWFAISVLTYSLAVLIWIWFFSVPEKTKASGPMELAPSPGELEQYKEVLRRMR